MSATDLHHSATIPSADGDSWTFRPGLSTEDKARYFVAARAGAYHGYFGSSFETAREGWKPKIGRLAVVNRFDPAQGYANRAEAVEAAQSFKRQCAEFLAKARGEA